MIKSITLDFGEEKKHSVRYNEPRTTADADSLAKSVYVQKSALPRPFPRQLKLTLESVE